MLLPQLHVLSQFLDMISFSLLLLLLSSSIEARYASLKYHKHAQVHPHASRSPPLTPGNSSSYPQLPATAFCEPYWLENVKHQGVASFNSNSTYQVFRNVKDYGAAGDGLTDDTAAIQRAVSEGGRCAPGVCQSSTTTPAVVYFPQGTYLISASILDYYYTQVYFRATILAVMIIDCRRSLEIPTVFPHFWLLQTSAPQLAWV